MASEPTTTVASSDKKFVCGWNGCGKRFTVMKNLRRHQRTDGHGVTEVGKLLCPVDLCSRRFPFMTSLCDHVRVDHKVKEAVLQVKSFDSYEKFTDWKIQLEEATESYYVQHESRKKYGKSEFMYLYCNRSGQESKTRLKCRGRIRKSKSGICKMDAVCTAHMSVGVDPASGKTTCKFCSAHVGHTKGLAQLSTANQLQIASLVQEGVTVSHAMDKMQARIIGDLQRDGLLGRQDIHNFRSLFNMNCIQKHKDDHTSVDICIHEMQAFGDANPVLMYKRQGEAPAPMLTGMSSSDFVLCLQTPTQRQFMLKFGAGSVICLDSIRGTNQYAFNLVTVLVIDDFGEANPVAFLIATKEDEAVLSLFFQSIKAYLPKEVTFSASHVMTDDASQYYNAWVSVFGPAQKLLCVAHADRTWRKAIKENIAGEERQMETYHMIRSVLQEVDEHAFRQCLEALLEHLRQMAPQFATYFEGYCARAHEWAYCFRKDACANTNLSLCVESFRNVLKIAYMERKANLRIDTLLHALLKIAKDKAFEHRIKVEKNEHSKKLSDINSRHVITAAALPPMTDGGWSIQSQSAAGTAHFVVVASDSCNCSLRCSSCQCCPHMYKCTCVDLAVHATVCEHVHTVHELRMKSRKSEHDDVDLSLASAPEVEVRLVQEADDNEPSVVPIEVKPIKVPKRSSDRRKVITAGILSDCRELIAMIASNDCSLDVLLDAEKHLRAAKAAVQTASVQRPAQLPVTKGGPGQKLNTQFRFRRLRANGKPTKAVIRKPNVAQVTAVKNKLLQSARQTAATNSNGDGAQQMNLIQSADLPYCIDTEVVV